MSEETNKTGDFIPMNNTDLAFERTQLAHERTLMAWVRTATSMISFGFSLYKIFEEFGKKDHHHTVLTPRIVGMLMITLALVGLLLAQVQHYQAMKELRKSYPQTKKSIASALSAMIFAFGVLLLLAAFFRE